MTMTLYTFAMSHYSEKIRWTLDHTRLPYAEVCMTPAFHMLPALIMGGRGQTTLPILKTPGQSIQDSTHILAWLEQHHGPLAVLPAHLKAEVMAVEERFDAIGKDVARLLYFAAFGVGDAHIIGLWTDHATPLQAMVIRRAYPLIAWAFRRKLSITPARAERARQRIGEVLAWLEDQLKDGRTYLLGDRFTVADITAASLLAPMACPSQHPVYSDPEYRRVMAAAMAPWQNGAALAWVRRMYDLERGQLTGAILKSA